TGRGGTTQEMPEAKEEGKAVRDLLFEQRAQSRRFYGPSLRPSHPADLRLCASRHDSGPPFAMRPWTPDFGAVWATRLSRLCRCCFPGQAKGVDFLRCWLVRVRCGTNPRSSLDRQ